MNNKSIGGSSGTYEEIFRGHEIYIEPNLDHYRGGSVWSVCKDECELECGLATSADEALVEAHAAIEKLDN